MKYDPYTDHTINLFAKNYRKRKTETLTERKYDGYEIRISTDKTRMPPMVIQRKETL